MGDKVFRSLRNGFAHWGFDWEVIGRDSYVVAYDWDRDLPIAKLHQEEADAFHICAFALIEVINDVFLGPELCLRLPPHPTSQRRGCRSANGSHDQGP